MSSFLRLAALALFGAVGIAAAVALALSATPDSAAAGPADEQAPATAAALTEEQALAPETKPDQDEGSTTDAPAEDLAEESEPEQPVVAKPRPAIAQQFQQQPGPGNPQGDTGGGLNSQNTAQLLELTRALLNQAAPQNGVNQNAGGTPSGGVQQPLVAPGPAQASGASGDAGPGNLPAPNAAGPAARTPGGRTPSAIQPRRQISKARGEGDDNLTIHFQDLDIREVLDLLSEQGNLNILASNNVQGTVSAALNDVDVDTALAAILKSTGYIARREGSFIYVGTSADFQNMQQSLDKIGSRIYRPNYVKATELQALILPLMTQGVGTISISSPSQIGIAANSNDSGGDTFGGNEAVLVKDYEAVLAQVDQVFEEIDKRPMQVAIEAMILSIRLNDANNFGVDFQALRDKGNVRLGTGQPLSDLGQFSFKDGGLKFGFLDSSLGAFLNALETIGDTNVIATPRLMCLNKHRAEILIGAQLGYLNSTTVNLTTTTQSVAFLEVGTQLRLRPFISTDGMIRMEVHPESSTGSVRVESGFTLPDKEVTQVTTNVLVPDGSTVIIGGLMREDLTKNVSQVPVLGSLPAVGFLFRSNKETIERRELVVLITPHIVYEPEMCAEGEKGACEFHRRHSVYADHMCPIGTRYLGRRYFRMAQKAWAVNEKKAALRFVNLAINFDPVNRAAIDLRSDIMAGSHSGDHSGSANMPLVNAAGPSTVPGWVLDEIEGSQPARIEVEHPREAGRTGRARSIERPGSMR